MRDLKCLFTLGIALFLVACGSAYKPPQPAPLQSFQPTLRVQTAWVKKINNGTGGEYLKLTPAISNNTIFVSSYSGEITAVNAQTGKKLWQINARVPLTSGIAAANNMLFVGSDQGMVLALQQSDGKVAWWAPMTSEVLATPCATNKTVIFKAENGEVSAFNINTGKRQWSYHQQEPSLILRGSGAPRIFSKYAIIGFASGQLAAFNSYTGQPLWQQTIAEGHGRSAVQRMVDIDVNPTIVNGTIYIASYQGNIAALNLKNGHVLWRHKLSSYSGLAVKQGHVYVSDDEGHIWAFDSKTGAVLWKQIALAYHGLTAPAIIKNAVVVADAYGYLHFVAQTDGHFVARSFIKNANFIAAPLTVGNNIYVYSTDGKLAKFAVG